MKYKLTNNQTKEEHLCDKVIIDGFDYYVSDEKLIPNCYVFDPIRNRITVIYLVSKKGENFGAKKVIATNNPSIDIPKVVDELMYKWNLGLKVAEKSKTKNKTAMRNGFVKGYDKSQETHPFSEQDMIEFYKWLNKNGWQDYNDVKPGLFINSYGVQKQDKELLQLWKEQQPKIVYYEKSNS